MALPPIISATRLRFALEPNGFPSQFPQAAGLCSHDLLKAIEDTAAKPGRRALPTATAAAVAPPPPPEEAPAAESPVAALPPSPKKTRPESPTKAVGWGAKEVHSEERCLEL